MPRNQAANGTRNGSAAGPVMRLIAANTATRLGRRARAASTASTAGSTTSASGRPHHAETDQVTGHSSTTATAPRAAQGRSRNHQPTAAAMPSSARLAGTFVRARIAGSDASDTVRNAGSSAARPASTQAIAAGRVRSWS